MEITQKMLDCLNATVDKVINGVKIVGFIPDYHTPTLTGVKDNDIVFIRCKFAGESLVIQ